MTMSRDSAIRIAIAAMLYPRTVDLINWTTLVSNRFSDAELLNLEAKLGALWKFSGRAPSGHYRLNMEQTVRFYNNDFPLLGWIRGWTN